MFCFQAFTKESLFSYRIVSSLSCDSAFNFIYTLDLFHQMLFVFFNFCISVSTPRDFNLTSLRFIYFKLMI